MGQYEPNAYLSGWENLNSELALVRVTFTDKSPIVFEPGQYVEIAHIMPDAVTGETSADTILRRQYSIASASMASSEIELYVVLVKEGALTPKLWGLNLGAPLWMNPKVKGKFTLKDIPNDKDLVMISTGTGIAPFMSMLRTYRGQNRWRRFVMIHGARYQQDLGYRDELEALCEELNSVFYIPTLTREASDSGYAEHRGRVQSIFEDGTYESVVGADFTPENCQIFLCGNPEMIDTMEVYLQSRGFKHHKKKDPGQIHVEKYW